jgi:hypothetical protein
LGGVLVLNPSKTKILFMIFFSTLLSSCSTLQNFTEENNPGSIALITNINFSNDSVKFYDNLEEIDLNEVIYIGLDVEISNYLTLSEIRNLEANKNFAGRVVNTIFFPFASVAIALGSLVVSSATGAVVLGGYVFFEPFRDAVNSTSKLNDYKLDINFKSVNYIDHIIKFKGKANLELLDTSNTSLKFYDKVMVNSKERYVFLVNYPFVKDSGLETDLDFNLELFLDGKKVTEFEYKIRFQ